MKVRYVCSDGLVHSDPVNGESEGVTKNERRQARVVYGPYGIHYVRTTSVVAGTSIGSLIAAAYVEIGRAPWRARA